MRERADQVGRAIGEGIKPVAAAFLELQPLLVLGAADPATGAVWASPLTGAPGFVRATGPRQMSVTGGVLPADPLAPALATEGTQVATIALDPRTRRRMRLNGRLRPTARGFAVTAERVFSNCPRYIQRRESYEVMADTVPGRTARSGELSSRHREFIASADTFFIATAHEGRVEVSHKGGNPGFVQAGSPHELSWRDYPGNSMFLTLGNLRSEPRAGLLFLDWRTGAALQLTGEARTETGEGRGDGEDGDEGELRVRFVVTEVVETPAAVPLRWSAPEYSPANPARAH